MADSKLPEGEVPEGSGEEKGAAASTGAPLKGDRVIELIAGKLKGATPGLKAPPADAQFKGEQQPPIALAFGVGPDGRSMTGVDLGKGPEFIEACEPLEELQMEINDRGRLYLAQGDVQKFNKLRAENKQWKPNLSKIKLKNIILPGVNFRDCDLHESIFVNAGLIQSDFSGANLTGSKMAMARMSGSKMTGAILKEADLLRTVLSESDLREADFTGAKLSKTDFQNSVLEDAIFEGAIFDGTDLRGAKLLGATGLTAEQLSQSVFFGATGLARDMVLGATKMMYRSVGSA